MSLIEQELKANTYLYQEFHISGSEKSVMSDSYYDDAFSESGKEILALI